MASATSRVAFLDPVASPFYRPVTLLLRQDSTSCCRGEAVYAALAHSYRRPDFTPITSGPQAGPQVRKPAWLSGSFPALQAGGHRFDSGTLHLALSAGDSFRPGATGPRSRLTLLAARSSPSPCVHTVLYGLAPPAASRKRERRRFDSGTLQTTVLRGNSRRLKCDVQTPTSVATIYVRRRERDQSSERARSTST